MTAVVQKDVTLSVVVPRNEERVAQHRTHDVVVGRGNLHAGEDSKWGAAQDLGFLDLGDLGIPVVMQRHPENVIGHVGGLLEHHLQRSSGQAGVSHSRTLLFFDCHEILLRRLPLTIH